jgi:hypothetical protein
VKAQTAQQHRVLGFPVALRPCPTRNHTDRFQVLDAFDYGNFAAVVSDNHLGCLPHSVLWRAASKIGDHNVFVLVHEWRIAVNSSNMISYFERLWRVT